MRRLAGMLLLRRRRLEGMASVTHHFHSFRCFTNPVSPFRLLLTQDNTCTVLSASGIKHVITFPGATSRK